MLNSMRWHNSHDTEHGFTMTELLVTIGIIGILAAVAVPMFLNQRRVAVDTATQTDVKNIADQVESGLADYRTAQCVQSPGNISSKAESLTINYYQDKQGSSAHVHNCHLNNTSHLGSITVPLSKDTRMLIYGHPHSDTGFTVEAWNETGNMDGTPGKIFIFKSQQGGFQ